MSFLKSQIIKSLLFEQETLRYKEHIWRQCVFTAEEVLIKFVLEHKSEIADFIFPAITPASTSVTIKSLRLAKYEYVFKF